ncbi:hypothetical protein TW95_gp1442 [Pandoravirus inopinatum]|uniref:Uncharacterized protein n=1 Tax=Pandoravirus inopinatum TaxID=1605721 RepID=A0A0B5JB26_9VIRU|nr:hypothetical protein TW95_gp1442 [Pandoravirus inopinatum]AJF98176.1 hypothetical protein [Pandoravirus inopinatum]
MAENTRQSGYRLLLGLRGSGVDVACRHSRSCCAAFWHKQRHETKEWLVSQNEKMGSVRRLAFAIAWHVWLARRSRKAPPAARVAGPRGVGGSQQARGYGTFCV